MSSPDNNPQTGATFLWVFGCFAGFAALFYVFQALFGGLAEQDARAEERLAARQEIAKEQTDLLTKMGLNDKAKSAAVFTKTATTLKAKKAAKSAALVPGSPTQLKQMEAEAAAAPPAAEGEKEKPAAEGAKPAEAAPAPAAPQN